ncbi:hypothetical protein AB0C18_37310 [Nonomuraea muscovyensis]
MMVHVEQPGHDGSAEWNVYWDPDAAKRVFDSAVPSPCSRWT